MSVSYDEALTANDFYFRGKDSKGNPHCYWWRRNGQTKTWKTRPGEYQVGLKWGLYHYCRLSNFDRPISDGDESGNIDLWHTHDGTCCPFEGDPNA